MASTNGFRAASRDDLVAIEQRNSARTDLQNAVSGLLTLKTDTALAAVQKIGDLLRSSRGGIDKATELRAVPMLIRWIHGNSYLPMTLKACETLTTVFLLHMDAGKGVGFWGGQSLLYLLHSADDGAVTAALDLLSLMVRSRAKFRDELAEMGISRYLVDVTNRPLDVSILCSAAMCLEALFTHESMATATDLLTDSLPAIEQLLVHESAVLRRVVCNVLPTLLGQLEPGHVDELCKLGIVKMLVDVIRSSVDDAAVKGSLKSINSIFSHVQTKIGNASESPGKVAIDSQLEGKRKRLSNDRTIPLRRTPTKLLDDCESLHRFVEELLEYDAVHALAKSVHSANVEIQREAVTATDFVATYLFNDGSTLEKSALGRLLRPLVDTILDPSSDPKLRRITMRAVDRIVRNSKHMGPTEILGEPVSGLDLDKLQDSLVAEHNEIRDLSRRIAKFTAEGLGTRGVDVTDNKKQIQSGFEQRFLVDRTVDNLYLFCLVPLVVCFVLKDLYVQLLGDE